MAIVFAETRKLPGLRSVKIIGTLTFSGNYATGGEVPTGITKPGTTKDPIRVDFAGRGIYDYKYDSATGKVLVFTGGVQHAAAAYNAAVTGDLVTMEIEYPKFG